MRRVTTLSIGGIMAVAVFSVSATKSPSAATPRVTREVIAVYLGTVGTDAQSGMTTAVREMKMALAKQAAASGRQFVSRGVSLDPTVEGGLQHLALLGQFDEISVGDNWTNSVVVRYLGPNFGDSRAAIPQVVLLEREVQQENSTLIVGPERELGRYIGVDKIGAWVRQGAPLPR